jgi:hypothetical protein
MDFAMPAKRRTGGAGEQQQRQACTDTLAAAAVLCLRAAFGSNSRIYE